MSENDDRRWLIVQTKPGYELIAQLHLRRRGFRCWFWHCFRNEAAGDKRSRATRCRPRPFFNRYLFVKNTRRLDVVNETDGVSTVLYRTIEDGREAVPLTVAHKELRALADFLDVQEDGFVPESTLEKIDKLPEIKAGERFTVLNGAFENFLATAVSTLPLDGRRKVEAYLEAFGRQWKLKLDQAQIGEIVQ